MEVRSNCQAPVAPGAEMGLQGVEPGHVMCVCACVCRALSEVFDRVQM